jgi:hypothetical protein
MKDRYPQTLWMNAAEVVMALPIFVALTVVVSVGCALFVLIWLPTMFCDFFRRQP